MKTFILPFTLIAMACAAPLTLTSCKEKGPAEKVGEGIDDALDNRPAEKVQDAAEDIKDAVKDATN